MHTSTNKAVVHHKLDVFNSDKKESLVSMLKQRGINLGADIIVQDQDMYGESKLYFTDLNITLTVPGNSYVLYGSQLIVDPNKFQLI